MAVHSTFWISDSGFMQQVLGQNRFEIFLWWIFWYRSTSRLTNSMVAVNVSYSDFAGIRYILWNLRSKTPGEIDVLGAFSILENTREARWPEGPFVWKFKRNNANSLNQQDDFSG